MKNFNVLIVQEGEFFIARNIDIDIVSQGKSVDEALENLKEATELFLEDETPTRYIPTKSFLTTIAV